MYENPRGGDGVESAIGIIVGMAPGRGKGGIEP